MEAEKAFEKAVGTAFKKAVERAFEKTVGTTFRNGNGRIEGKLEFVTKYVLQDLYRLSYSEVIWHKHGYDTPFRVQDQSVGKCGT